MADHEAVDFRDERKEDVIAAAEIVDKISFFATAEGLFVDRSNRGTLIAALGVLNSDAGARRR